MNIIYFSYELYDSILKRNKKNGVIAGNMSNSKINDKRLITGLF